MTRVLLDQTTLSRFYNPSEQVEVCDEAGRTLGHFTPLEDRSLYERVEVPFTEEELDFILNYDIKYRLGQSESEKED